MNRNDIIRENIKKAITEARVSKLHVANNAQISYKYLIQFLNNKRVGGLGIDILQRLAEVLNVPLSYFLADTDKKGDAVYIAKGKQLPPLWDETMKTIIDLPEKEQKKLHDIINLLLEQRKQ